MEDKCIIVFCICVWQLTIHSYKPPDQFFIMSDTELESTTRMLTGGWIRLSVILIETAQLAILHATDYTTQTLNL